MSSCFSPNLGGVDSIGWCATCDPNAKRGQRGYCGSGETTREEEAPVIYPNSTNWGFCNKNCHNSNRDPNVLQAEVDFISIRHLKLYWVFNYTLNIIIFLGSQVKFSTNKGM